MDIKNAVQAKEILMEGSLYEKHMEKIAVSNEKT